MLRFGLSYRLLVLLSGLCACHSKIHAEVVRLELYTTVDCLQGLFGVRESLVWGLYHLYNPLYYRAIESVVLHFRAKTCRVNRTSHNNKSSLPVETYLPWLSCWIVTILRLNLSKASNLLYTGLRSNLTLLTILSFRSLLLLTPFWFFFNLVLSCNLAAIWRWEMCQFSGELLASE